MAFQQGLSGLNATSKNLSVIGNNIANANTFGAKASRAEFSDIYANAINGSGSNGVGIGVNLSAITQQFSQGNITTTDSSLDLAINGNGFFQLDNAGTTVYSRNGQFQINKDGNIVNSSGQKLLGYAANANGQVVPSSVQALQLPTAGVAPSATTKTTLELNLDARSKSIPTGGTPPIDFADPTTYTNATSVTVFDAKGQSVALTYYFQKTADNSDGTIDPPPPAASSGDGKAMWDVYLTANGIPIPTDGSGLPSATVITGMT
ncbi:MAG: flagellar hook-basal body complex protein, partial [Burkholderiales bacterium]|nr:flagellar hook-basal body complex protein [Burkholderiales bacterium]